MKCNTCGKEIRDKMLYCPYCNSKQEINDLTETPSSLKQVTKQHIAHPSEQKAEDNITEVPEDLIASTIDFDDLDIEESDEWIISELDEAEKSVPSPTEALDKKAAETETLKKNDKSTSSSSKRKRKKSKNYPDVSHSKVNKDGYYDPIPPSQKEDFPFLKGEFIAKVLFLILTIIILALFLIYFL